MDAGLIFAIKEDRINESRRIVGAGAANFKPLACIALCL